MCIGTLIPYDRRAEAPEPADAGLDIISDAIASHIWTDVLKARGDYTGWFEDKRAAAKLIHDALALLPPKGLQEMAECFFDVMEKHCGECECDLCKRADTLIQDVLFSAQG